MKYHQPYGVTDPNAGYVNGNPSTGTMGSIPPAESIEYPQREITNFILDTGGITLSDIDMHQMAKSVQAGGVNYADDTGTPNQLVCNLVPPPNALRKGLHVFTLIANNNYVGAGATLNLNSLGAVAIKHLDHSDLAVNELKAGLLALFVYDGSFWQWMSAAYTPVTTGTLQANRDYYVNPTTGLDTNDGLSAASPFKTIQYAANRCVSVNLNNYSINVHCAAGTYPENIFLSPLNGNGYVNILGDESTPANCTIHPAGGNCIAWGSIFTTSGYQIYGFRLTSTAFGGGGYQGAGIFAGYGSVRLGSMEFGPCQNAHVNLMSGCKITIDGVRHDNGGPAFWRITGGAVYHIVAGSGSEVLNYGPQLILTGTPNFTYFIESTQLSQVNGYFSGGISGSATGSKFYCDLNSVIRVSGAGINYLPGSTAGIQATGGQYI